MKLLITNLKHFLTTSVVLFVITICIGISYGVDVDVGDNRLAYTLDGEGPYIFFEGDQLVTNHIRGDREKGFRVEQERYSKGVSFFSASQFKLEDSQFEFRVTPEISVPSAVYDDKEPILAISDIESNYKALRDFLVANEVVDSNLNWTFGKGHLVLVGDFVDRGFSTTQVLWFIYKLEKSAELKGGRVHYILGNHEIKNLQGNFQKAADKYFHIASILGKHQHELFGSESFLGRWLASKNSMEMINGHLFVHGGIHPRVAKTGYSLDDINRIVREKYRQAYFPKPGSSKEDALLSTLDGPSWYRGYFDGSLTQEDVEAGLRHFNARDVIVGHHPQWKVNASYNDKVFAIDVKHPNDYRGSFPSKRSEGLLIERERYFRVLDNGTKHKLSEKSRLTNMSIRKPAVCCRSVQTGQLLAYRSIL